MSGTEERLVDHVRRRIVRERRVVPGEGAEQALRGAVEDILDEERRELSASQRSALAQAVADEALGLGPLEALLRRPDVSEVMVNAPDSVWIERAGRIERSTVRFADTAHVMHVADRILSRVGRRVDEASPMADARLADGSRVNVIVPPLAVDGPVITIRRFASAPLSLSEMRSAGTLDVALERLLVAAVNGRLNVLVSGGTGSGKTTTLAALAAVLGPEERVVTVEDAAELRLRLPHVVRLESRPPGLDGRGAVPIRALVRNALRMRPDRIIVGEVRGGEALDMLQALSSGHDGSLSTLHASSPGDALRRLATLALMGELDLPYRAVADQVAAAIDLVVHMARAADGTRRIAEIAEVEAGAEGPRARPLARWSATAGGWQLTEASSRWLRRLDDRGGAA